MKNRDFAYYLQNFLTKYLVDQKGVSINTIASYRDTIILLIKYIERYEKIKVTHIKIEHIDYDLINRFLNYLETNRNVCINTRNNRLAAIHSFVRYLTFEYPDYINEYQMILEIPFKKHKKTVIQFLSVDEIKILLDQFNKTDKKEYRNYFMILLMYETAIRVSELTSIKVQDFHITKPYYLKVVGKGNKERLIPVSEIVINKLKKYLEIFNLNTLPTDHLLFFNSRKEQLTRVGVSYILNTYIKKAMGDNPSLFKTKVTPHVLRHSKAVHLLQNDVNLIYIRDFLGHSSIQTTEIYAKADSKRKYEAIVGAYNDILPDVEPEWHNKDILDFLQNFLK